MSKARRAFIAVLGLLVPLGELTAEPMAVAKPVVAAAACEERSRTEAVVVLVCQTGLDETTLVSAGKAACGTRVPCNAWMWDDALKAPEKAPVRDGDMPKATASAAVGVWANDSKLFVRVRRARP